MDDSGTAGSRTTRKASVIVEEVDFPVGIAAWWNLGRLWEFPSSRIWY
jgi:hypothetical protein